MSEVLGNWGEFIGGIAVVLSLVYVAVQLRSSVRQARIDSYVKVAEMLSHWTNSIYQNEDTARVWSSGLRDFESLSAEDRLRFGLMASMYFGLVDTIIGMEKSGFYDFPDSYQAHLDNATRLYRFPGTQQWKNTEGALMSPHIRQYFEEST